MYPPSQSSSSSPFPHNCFGLCANSVPKLLQSLPTWSSSLEGPPHPSNNSFNKYLLSNCYVPGPTVGIGQCSWKQERERSFSNGAYIAEETGRETREISAGTKCYRENKQGHGTQRPGHTVSKFKEKEAVKASSRRVPFNLKWWKGTSHGGKVF